VQRQGLAIGCSQKHGLSVHTGFSCHLILPYRGYTFLLACSSIYFSWIHKKVVYHCIKKMLFHLDSVQCVHVKVYWRIKVLLNLIYIYFLLKMSLLMLVVQTNLRNSSLLREPCTSIFHEKTSYLIFLWVTWFHGIIIVSGYLGYSNEENHKYFPMTILCFIWSPWLIIVYTL
jgi:hypothetical protein